MASRKKTTRTPAPRRKPAPAEPAPRTELIYSALMAVMADIQPIIKSETSPDRTFNFAKMDNVTAALRPLMIEHRILAVPHAIREHIENVRPTLGGGLAIFTKVTVQWRFYAQDGSWLPAETIGEGLSNEQHSTAAAQTMAFKTVLEKTFMLPMITNGHDPEPESSCVGELDPSSVPSEGIETVHTVAPASVPTQGALPAVDEVITPGLFNMLKNNLEQHPNLLATTVCTKFGIEVGEGNTALNALATDLKRSQMNDAMEFIRRDGKDS